MNQAHPSLPPGQIARTTFDRFGLGLFANRFPTSPSLIRIEIAGDVEKPAVVENQIFNLPRIEQISDFHCVTTWSVLALKWGGFRFSDFYERIVVPLAAPRTGASFVVLKGQDGFRVSMQLQDLLQPDVLLADSLNDEPLGIAHGAPLRLVAPAHYGYKNMKHICAIEFWTDGRHYSFPFPYPNLMDHPRGRVAYEERAKLIPGAWIRILYRALIPLARRKSRKALERYMGKGNEINQSDRR